MRKILNMLASALDREIKASRSDQITIRFNRKAVQEILDVLRKFQTLSVRNMVQREMLEMYSETDIKNLMEREIANRIADEMLKQGFITFRYNEDPIESLVLDRIEVRGSVDIFERSEEE